MKLLRISAVVLIASAVLSFIRAGRDFHIAKVLPFCDGQPISKYHWAGLIMCGIAFWGYCRLRDNNRDDH